MDASRRRHGRALLFTKVFAKLSLLLLSAAALADSRFSILYHEPVVLRDVLPAGQGFVTHDAAEIVHFDAFGRRFELQLELPDRLNRRHRNSDFELFTGRVAATPESWVRLMRRGDRLSGIIHDATDTYFIEPRSTIVEALADADPRHDSINVIYRLADTLVAPGLLSCKTRQSSDPVNGQAAFTKLAAELTAANTETAAAHIPTARIGVIADIDFFARFDSESASQIESLFNVVDGIFSAQVGVEINVTESLIIAAESQNPFSATTVAGDLLDELSDWRRLNQADLGLTHLVTDRALSSENPADSIAGLSFFGVPGRAGVCFAQSGAGISAWFGNLTALIIAHEIAHNFGAPHDGEPSDNPLSANPCESTPSSGFLMSATLSSAQTDQFSQCSLQEMQQVIDAAGCLTTSAASTPSPTPAAAGGGGGGALNWLSLLTLLAMAIIRRAKLSASSTARVAA